jgi:hypothetical protein
MFASICCAMLDTSGNENLDILRARNYHWAVSVLSNLEVSIRVGR